MGYTLIDYFKALHCLSSELNLSAGSRSMYFAILGEFNAAHFPERINFSYRQLQSLAGLKSVASAHDCANVLKNKKLINFTKNAHGSIDFSLSTEHLPNENALPAEHLPNASRTPEVCSNIDTCAETLDVKTKNNSSDDVRTRELDELIDFWTEIHGGRLTFEQQSYLNALLAKKGKDFIRNAMNTAANVNRSPQGINFRLLQGVINREEERKITHEKNGYQYSKPDRKGSEPWL